MRITFHISQMPNVICETNMKREFKFSKNLPLQRDMGNEDDSPGREGRWESHTIPGWLGCGGHVKTEPLAGNKNIGVVW